MSCPLSFPQELAFVKILFSAFFQYPLQFPFFLTAGLFCASLALEGCRNPTLVASGGGTPADGVKGGATQATVVPGEVGTPEVENTTGRLPAESPKGELPRSLPGVSHLLPARPAGWTVVKAMPTLDVLKKEGGGQRLFLARIVLASHPVRVVYTNGALKGTRDLVAKCKVGINAGYFSGSQSMSLLSIEGKVVTPGITQLNRNGVSQFPSRGALSVSQNQARVGWASPRAGKVYVYHNPQSLGSLPSGGSEWTASAIVGGGPVLLKGGQPRVTWKEELFDGESGIGPTDKNPRTAAGTDATGGLLYLLVSDGRSFRASGHTLAGLAAILKEVGVREAVNFDGGGSSTFVMDGRILNSPSSGSERAVYSALCVN